MERCSYNAQINLPDEGTALVLTIEKPRFAGSIAGLPALLSVLHPGSVPVVERLSLIQCSIGAGVLGHCSALAAVTHLQLQVCDATAGNWEAALAAVFEQAPLLSGLNLYGILPCQLPQSVVNHSGLRQLALMWFGNEVSLPEGAYLASLEQLWLTYGAPSQLPPALAAATALTSLVLRGTQAPLSTDGMAALLSQLPLLRRLQLTNCSLKQLPLDGWAGMTAMQHLDLSENRLTSLPAMLYETPSLLQLDLSDNRQLARTAEQLGALLSSLPLLEVLDLSTTSLKTLPSQPPPGKKRVILVRCSRLLGAVPIRCCAAICSNTAAQRLRSTRHPRSPLFLLSRHRVANSGRCRQCAAEPPKRPDLSITGETALARQQACVPHCC